MDSLHSLNCQVCRADTPTVSGAELETLLTQIPDWALDRQDDVECLSRQFRFRNFREAFAFAGQIASLAEQQDHHPALRIEWGSVVVYWWTHRIGGLHLNDFIMAARTDRIAREAQG